jgi:hypothetical protein
LSDCVSRISLLPRFGDRRRPSWLTKAFALAEEAERAKAPITTDAEVDAEVARMMDAEVTKRKAVLREEVASRVRRSAFERKMHRINVEMPREFEARERENEPARLKAMDEEKARSVAKRAAWEKDAREREKAEEAARKNAEARMPRMGGGAEGFERR